MKKNLKRVASFVIALGVALSSAASISAADFSDVPSDSNYAESVSSLSSIGILNGYEDGSFKPDNNITRAEVAAVVVRALAQEQAAVSSKGATAFTDVSADHWASGYVNVASSGNNAFINGMGDGTFAPEANVTYAQVVKMLVAGIGYGDWGVSYGGYPTGYITAAKILKITDGVSTINADEAATRGTVAKLTYNALNTPLLALDSYSPTDPRYSVLDGADGRAYETPLTYYHNIYTVEGRITGTNRSVDGLEVGQVQYQIESTKNYGEDALVIKKSENYPQTEKMYVPEDIDADAYLNVYSKALVYVDEDEEATIISISASAKNQSVELDIRAWDDAGVKADKNVAGDTNRNAALRQMFGLGTDDKVNKSVKPQMYFFADADKKGKSSRYNLAVDKDGYVTYSLYVNGVEVDLTSANVEKYIFDNDVGTITFVDTPSEGSVSTDGKYDAIYVTYYQSAVVDSIGSNRLYFDDREGDLPSDLKFEWDDDDYDYSFIMDGKAIKFEDIKEGDVVSVAFNPTYRLIKDSNFYTIIVSRNTAEGKVNEVNEEDGEIGIGDDTFAVINGLSGDFDSTTTSNDKWDVSKYFNLGSTYTVSLDAFNRIVTREKSASSMKYAVILNAYADSSGDNYEVRICDSTGSTRTVALDEKVKITDKLNNGALTGDGESAAAALETYIKGLINVAGNGDGVLSGQTVEKLFDMDKRVISYETNSSGDIKKIELLKPNNIKVGKYKKNSDKLAGLSIGESTALLSKDDSSKTDVNKVNKSSLVDDNDYLIAAYGKESGDNEYPFVLIFDGVGSYNEDTRFAVVNSVKSATNDEGDTCNKLELWTADSKDIVEIYTDGTSPDSSKSADYNDINAGSVIIYKLNENDEIKDYELLFDPTLYNYENFVADCLGGRYDAWSVDYKKRVSAWDNKQDTDVNIVFGPVVDRSANGVSIAQNTSKYNDLIDGQYVDLSNVQEFGYDSDVAVYVYDLNYSRKERVFRGSESDVIKKNISKNESWYKDGKDFNQPSLKIADENGVDFPIAFAKTKDNDTITDILIIIPEDD